MANTLMSTSRQASEAFAALKRLEADPQGYVRQLGAEGYAQALAQARASAGAADQAAASARWKTATTPRGGPKGP